MVKLSHLTRSQVCTKNMVKKAIHPKFRIYIRKLHTPQNHSPSYCYDITAYIPSKGDSRPAVAIAFANGRLITHLPWQRGEDGERVIDTVAGEVQGGVRRRGSSPGHHKTTLAFSLDRFLRSARR